MERARNQPWRRRWRTKPVQADEDEEKIDGIMHDLWERTLRLPRQRIGCYHLYLLAETCTRALATARQADAPFLMGFINYAAVKYAPEDKRDKHIDNTRTWLSQCSPTCAHSAVLPSQRPTISCSRLQQRRVEKGKQKELFEGFSAFIKPLCEDKADSHGKPALLVRAGKEARPQGRLDPALDSASGRPRLARRLRCAVTTASA